MSAYNIVVRRRAIAIHFGAAVLAWLAISGAVVAQTETLNADAVLASSDAHFPGILASLAERRGAGGAVLEADGEFDLVFAADGFSRVAGFYDGSFVSAGVSQNLRALGGEVYAGYRLSDGTLPIYEDIYYTNEGGELAVGVLFSLLRDRQIDEQRFGLSDTRLALREADFDLLLTRIGVQQRALIAYWRWVVSGYELTVYEDLLQIALDRQSGLDEQVRSGALAEVFLTENGLNITNRRRLVAAAERNFQAATNGLSLYYRDKEGNALQPPRAALSPPPPIGVIEDLSVDEAPSISEALARRPELQLLRTAIERGENRIALAENELKPRLDLNLDVSNDFGDIGEGGPSTDGTQTVVGLSFSVPLQQRTARGRIMRERSEVDALLERQQLVEDQIYIEVQNIMLEMRVAEELLRLAEVEVSQAEIMAEAEQKRFASGASDFFLVNIREETAANARVRYYEADLARRIARANYDAGTVNLERLGISDEVGVNQQAF
jgi:outer membrane protein TolC